MGNKQSRQRKAAEVSSGVRLGSELGLDPQVWSVSAGYSKGILTKSRYTLVSVTHLPTGRTRSASFYAAGKAAARREAAAFVRRSIKELSGR